MGHSAGEASFEAFYRACRDRLARQLYLMTGDMGEAMDHVQEGFARAWARWPVVSQYEQPEGWVRRVAVNLAISRWRRVQRARVLPPAVPGDVPGPSPDRVALAAALRALPERQRAALVLHHVADLPVEDVARQLSVPVGTAKSLLVRGRARLALELAEHRRPASSGDKMEGERS